jgi:PAS domain S-box-containing protein
MTGAGKRRGPGTEDGSQADVLYVDDGDAAEVGAERLAGADERLCVETARSAAAGLERIEAGGVECVVSNYRLPDSDGLAFLEAVRERAPDLPFLLFTAVGSEQIASEAISAGVTDYMEKNSGAEQWTVLANRVANAVRTARAERGGRRERERIRRIYERTTECFVAVDADLRVTYANEQAADFYGLSAEELVGRRLTAFTDREPSPFVAEYERALATQEPATFEMESVLAEDTWLEVRAYPDDDGDGLSIYFRDVTERRRRRQVLEELHEVTRELSRISDQERIGERVVDAAVEVLGVENAAVYLHEGGSESERGTDGSVGGESERFVPAAVHAGTPEFEALPVLDAAATSIVGEVHRTGRRQIYDDIRTAGALYNEETNMRGGVFLPLDGHGVLAVVTTEPGIDDATRDLAGVLGAAAAAAMDRAERERRLARYETIVETVDDGVYVVDADSRFVAVNDALCEMTGYEETELVGSEVTVVTPEETVADIEEELAGVAAGGSAVGSVETALTTADGEEIPVEARYTLSNDGDETIRVGVTRDISERRARKRELEAYESIVEAAPDAIYALDGAGRISIANETFAETVGLPRADLIGRPLSLLVEEGVMPSETFERGNRALAEVTSTGEAVRFESTVRVGGEERVVENNLAPVDAENPGRGTVNVVRDVTERKRRAEALARQRDEVATLNRVNGLIQTVIGQLVEETSRAGIEETVCERLADADRYRFAWMGRPEEGTEELIPEAAVGLDADSVTLPDGSGGGTEGPVVTALETGRAQVVDDYREGSGANASGGTGPRPAIAVPLTDGDSVEGVLVVCADRADAFSEREREAFAVLGEVVGFALTAVRRQELLFADSLTELTLEVSDEGSPFIAASGELDCRVEFQGFVPREGNWLHYSRIYGADPETALAALTDADGIAGGRIVTDGEGALLELEEVEQSVVSTLTEHGAKVREAVAEGGEARIVAELPGGADVRRVTGQVRSAFPACELAGKRQVERRVQTAREFRDELAERLTERQRTALRTAHLAGYFEWPRGSNAEEIAESMGIASATLHQHLRAAQHKLLATFFEDSPRT